MFPLCFPLLLRQFTLKRDWFYIVLFIGVCVTVCSKPAWFNVFTGVAV